MHGENRTVGEPLKRADFWILDSAGGNAETRLGFEQGPPLDAGSSGQVYDWTMINEGGLGWVRAGPTSNTRQLPCQIHGRY